MHKSPIEISYLSSKIVPLEPTEIYFRHCNLGVCTITSPLTPSICSTNDDEAVELGLVAAEERIEGERLEEALQTMLVIGDGAETCDEVQVKFK